MPASCNVLTYEYILHHLPATAGKCATQRMWWANEFATARDDMMAMQPFAKLLCTLVTIIILFAKARECFYRRWFVCLSICL